MAWLLCNLNGCGYITIKNQTWWGSLQEEGAAQFDTLSPAKATLSFSDFVALWNDPNDPMICSHVSSFEDIQTNYQTICSDYPSECQFEGAAQLQDFFEQIRLLKLRGQIKSFVRKNPEFK